MEESGDNQFCIAHEVVGTQHVPIYKLLSRSNRVTVTGGRPPPLVGWGGDPRGCASEEGREETPVNVNRMGSLARGE